jgi:hypothetical protein
MTDSQYFSAAKAVAYIILFVAAVITLLRVVIGPLWGSASDLGMIAAVLAGAGGVIALAWLARVMMRDVAKGLGPDNGENQPS